MQGQRQKEMQVSRQKEMQVSRQKEMQVSRQVEDRHIKGKKERGKQKNSHTLHSITTHNQKGVATNCIPYCHDKVSLQNSSHYIIHFE